MGDISMKKRHSAEQIVAMLREAEVEPAKRRKVPEIVRKLGIAEQNYCRWRKDRCINTMDPYTQ